MKKNTFMVALLLMLAFVGTAGADEYLVKKGECLSQIGQETGVPWQNIAEENSKKAPSYTIRTGETLLIPEKKKRSENLGDRIDATAKWTHRERISGEANKRVDSLYGSVAVYPFNFDEHYVGIGGSISHYEGETLKGYKFNGETRLWGPRYKWLPKNGHEFGVGINFGSKDDGKKSNSARSVDLYYANTERKLAGESTFSEWCVWGGIANSDGRNSTSIGGRLYVADGEIWRLYADASAGFDSNSVVAVGLGVTDKQNIIEVGAGIRVGTQGVEWWVGPAVKPGNLLNGVVLKPALEAVNVSQGGVTPIVSNSDNDSVANSYYGVGGAVPNNFQEDFSHLGM
jgi:LysM repeat protein